MEKQPRGRVLCPECLGSGRKKENGAPCAGCEGTGVGTVFHGWTEEPPVSPDGVHQTSKKNRS